MIQSFVLKIFAVLLKKTHIEKLCLPDRLMFLHKQKMLYHMSNAITKSIAAIHKNTVLNFKKVGLKYSRKYTFIKKIIICYLVR